jgi:flagellar biosynthesis protein FliQ
VALIFFGPWMFNMLVQFTEQLMAQIPEMVR